MSAILREGLLWPEGSRAREVLARVVLSMMWTLAAGILIGVALGSTFSSEGAAADLPGAGAVVGGVTGLVRAATVTFFDPGRAKEWWAFALSLVVGVSATSVIDFGRSTPLAPVIALGLVAAASVASAFVIGGLARGEGSVDPRMRRWLIPGLAGSAIAGLVALIVHQAVRISDAWRAPAWAVGTFLIVQVVLAPLAVLVSDPGPLSVLQRRVVSWVAVGLSIAASALLVASGR